MLVNTELGKVNLKFGLGTVSKQDNGDKLFGAMFRKALVSDGFNIKLGIPPLPQIDNHSTIINEVVSNTNVAPRPVDKPIVIEQLNSNVWSLATSVRQHTDVLSMQRLWEDEGLIP